MSDCPILHNVRRSSPAVRVVVALFVAISGVPRSVVAAQDVTVLRGATIVDGTGAPPVTGGVLVVRGDRIACVGTAPQCMPPTGAREVDVTGSWLMPGIVDAHVHYSQTGWADGRPDAFDARERFPYERTIAQLRADATPIYRANLCAGVTATFDVGGYAWTWDLARDDARSDAPHVAAAGPLLTTRDHWLNVPAERQFLHIGSDSATRAGARYLIENRTPAIKIWFVAGPTAPDTADIVRRVLLAGALAREAGIPLIVHATGLWQAKHALRAGAALLVHGVADQAVDDEFLRLARAANTIYTPTLVVNDGYRQLRARAFQATDYPLECVDPATRAKAFLTDSLPGRPADEVLARAEEQAVRRFEIEAANVRLVHAAGIRVAMGTDAGNPLTLHGPSVYLEMEALQRAGLSPAQVISASTAVGAAAMGRSADFGTLEAGKLADLIVLGADPLADIRNVRRVTHVMRAGVLRTRAELSFGR